MDDELRMKLADLGSPEALADCIVDHYPDLGIPIPLARIAEAVGIIEIIGQTTDGFEGVLITDGAKAKGSIAYNAISKLERRRFTIAHELGHFLLPLHGASAQCAKTDMGVFKSNDPNCAREAEANRFAAALLMPKKFFARDIRRLGTPETEHIVRLAAEYEVSKEAAARRYTDFCDHMCAVIFSHQGRLRYFCKTPTFPFIDIRNAQPLPANSISARKEGEPGQMSEWSETAPEIWIGASHRFRSKVLYEQFLEQANGYRLSMLTIDEAPDEEEPNEDAELEERWTPRFRR
jgi:Zn-dependent peptidase ImmA (M78 family)